MDVSIIIVSFNIKNLLKNCLTSIFNITKEIEYEVIVVDNTSIDGTLEMIESDFPDVILVRNKTNKGFGIANNEGVKISHGRNIFFLNPDTILLNNAVKELSDYLDRNPNVGAVGGNLFNSDLKPAHSFKRYFPSIFWEVNELFCGFPEKLLYGRSVQFNYTNNPVDVAFLTGADLMIPRRVFDLAGGFDKRFFMYFEESDFEKRIAKLKYKRVCVPTSKIIHLEGGSIKNDEEKIEFYLKGRQHYLKSNLNPFSKSLCNVVFFIKIYSRIIIFVILFNKQKIDYWIKMRALFKCNH